MIALWEGFNLLHDIIIPYPNGYVLCVRVCVVVDVDCIKNQKPIINEYNHNSSTTTATANTYRKSEIHMKKSQWLNDKPDKRELLVLRWDIAQKFYERIKHTLEQQRHSYNTFDTTGRGQPIHWLCISLGFSHFWWWWCCCLWLYFVAHTISQLQIRLNTTKYTEFGISFVRSIVNQPIWLAYIALVWLVVLHVAFVFSLHFLLKLSMRQSAMNANNEKSRSHNILEKEKIYKRILSCYKDIFAFLQRIKEFILLVC